MTTYHDGGFCECTHPKYCAEDCARCSCLPSFGRCAYELTWGDHYAGGVTAMITALLGSRYCERHGGSTEYEMATLRRQIQLHANPRGIW